MAARWIYHAHECALAGELIVESVTESLIQDEAPGGPVHQEASLRVTTKCQRKFELPMNPNVFGGNPAVRRVVKGFRIGW